MKKIILLLVFAAVATSVSAQLSAYDREVSDNFWVGGCNPAALTSLPEFSIGKAEASFGKQNGEFRDFSSSPDSYDFGFGVEALRSMGNTRYQGGIGYNYFDGKQMCGSMFTSPNEFPVDIIEYTFGRKIRERYNVSGSFATALNEVFAVGAGVDYRSSNYAKRKDLRHKNTKMDMSVKVGVTGNVPNDVLVGISGFYRRKTEKITAEEIGTLNQNYDAFFNSGNWYGARQLWTGSSIHLQETGLQYFPVAENICGVAIQGMAYDMFNRGHKLEMELVSSISSGQTGERGIVWHNFDTDYGMFRFVVSRVGESSERWLHRLYGSIATSETHNREAVLGRETANGVTQTVVYDYNPIFAERRLWFDAGYKLDFDDDYLSGRRWRFNAGAECNQSSSVSSLMYPTYKNRYYTVWSPYASVDNSVSKGKHIFGSSVGYRYSYGTGRADKSISPQTDMTLGDYADYEADLAAYEWEWLTAPRHTLRAGLNYGRRYGREYAKRIYIKADYSFTFTDARLKHIGGSTRHLVSFAVGMEF